MIGVQTALGPAQISLREKKFKKNANKGMPKKEKEDQICSNPRPPPPSSISGEFSFNIMADRCRAWANSPRHLEPSLCSWRPVAALCSTPASPHTASRRSRVHAHTSPGRVPFAMQSNLKQPSAMQSKQPCGQRCASVFRHCNVPAWWKTLCR